MQFLVQDSLKNIFQKFECVIHALRSTLCALPLRSYAHQISFYETQKSSYFLPSTFAPCALLLAIYA
jgi:hypothetical protein